MVPKDIRQMPLTKEMGMTDKDRDESSGVFSTKFRQGLHHSAISLFQGEPRDGFHGLEVDFLCLTDPKNPLIEERVEFSEL